MRHAGLAACAGLRTCLYFLSVSGSFLGLNNFVKRNNFNLLQSASLSLLCEA